MQKSLQNGSGLDQLTFTWELLSKLKGIGEVLSRPLHLPRPHLIVILLDATKQVHLYGFCVASNAVCAAVVYVAQSSSEQKPPCFVVSKNMGVFPKVETIPHVEFLNFSPPLSRVSH